MSVRTQADTSNYEPNLQENDPRNSGDSTGRTILIICPNSFFPISTPRRISHFQPLCSVFAGFTQGSRRVHAGRLADVTTRLHIFHSRAVMIAHNRRTGSKENGMGLLQRHHSGDISPEGASWSLGG